MLDRVKIRRQILIAQTKVILANLCMPMLWAHGSQGDNMVQLKYYSTQI